MDEELSMFDAHGPPPALMAAILFGSMATFVGTVALSGLISVTTTVSRSLLRR
ncbi:MAG TPA: hypothetical protein VHV57_15495 [Acidimicrobiales bacterium]|jgi:hypothetical protein|nr:hypothetical protein [Acidimicrobiales bacterium]